MGWSIRLPIDHAFRLLNRNWSVPKGHELTGRCAQLLLLQGGTPVERRRQRDRVQPWRAWYKTSRWQKLRMSVLLRDLFTCQMRGCGRIEADTSQLVADHKIPHHGDEALFWDENNLQCLCKPCHDKLKQKQERASRFRD